MSFMSAKDAAQKLSDAKKQNEEAFRQRIADAITFMLTKLSNEYVLGYSSDMDPFDNVKKELTQKGYEYKLYDSQRDGSTIKIIIPE